LIEARSFGSTSHIQIQQLSAAAAASGVGFLSSSPDLRLAAAATGGDFFNPGGGFFLVSATLAFLARRRFDDDNDDDVDTVETGGLLVDDGTEAGNGVVLVLVLVLRFLDLVVGPATALLAVAATLPRVNVGATFVPTDAIGIVLIAAVN